jgi:phosphoserine aminotransferase
MTKHNFTAGPCILDQSVVQGAADALLNFENTGLSLISISHRDKRLVAVMNEAIALTKELLNLDEDYEVLFLQGGASMQFLMTAYNLMKVDGQAAYMNTGTWSKKAIKEAKAFGEVHVFASSEEDGFNHIPDMSSLPTGMDYVHCTSNNTIVGTEMTTFPATDDVLVCDMSSDIFSRPMDFNQFDLIYAGAQKNLGPAGCCTQVNPWQNRPQHPIHVGLPRACRQGKHVQHTAGLCHLYFTAHPSLDQV